MVNAAWRVLIENTPPLSNSSEIHSLGTIPAMSSGTMACILSVDDDENVRRTLSKGLSTLGHRVIEAENGHAGMRLAFCRKIDLILLDVSMPGMNGLQVLRKLKENHRTAHIPVIMLTGQDDSELRDQAHYDYSEGYILKTTSIRDINAKIMTVLENRPPLPDGWPTLLRW